MDYGRSLKTAQQLLEQVRSGQRRMESSAKAEAAVEGLEQGLIRRRAQEQQGASSSPADGFLEGFMGSYMELASAVPEQGVVSKGGEGQLSAPPVTGSLHAAREALAAVESRGSGDYSAVGPLVESGAYKGQRAYGRYQVMEGNIGPWTKKVSGKAYSKEEFLANKDGIQDKVVEYQLEQSYRKHGTWEDAASVWFSGQPVAKAGNRSDGFTTVPDYVRKFQKFFTQYAVTDESTKDAPRLSPRPQTKPFVEKPADAS
jgi:hypothetical protein